MKKLYRFRWDCGRMGYISGIFAKDEELVNQIIGYNVNFGEALGKHSEVCVTIDKGDITELTDDQDFIKKAEEYRMVPTGYNPFSYIDPQDFEEWLKEKED